MGTIYYSYDSVSSVLSDIQTIRPFLDGRNGLPAVEQLTFDDLARRRYTDFQLRNSISKFTAAGGGKQDELLIREIRAFQEGIDDGWSHIPYADK